MKGCVSRVSQSCWKTCLSSWLTSSFRDIFVDINAKSMHLKTSGITPHGGPFPIPSPALVETYYLHYWIVFKQTNTCRRFSHVLVKYGHCFGGFSTSCCIKQLIGFSCHCRLGNVSNACSEFPTGFATLLQYGSLEVILTESRIESHNCSVMFVLPSWLFKGNLTLYGGWGWGYLLYHRNTLFSTFKGLNLHLFLITEPFKNWQPGFVGVKFITKSTFDMHMHKSHFRFCMRL